MGEEKKNAFLARGVLNYICRTESVNKTVHQKYHLLFMKTINFKNVNLVILYVKSAQTQIDFLVHLVLKISI
jgi:hypothetical protein